MVLKYLRFTIRFLFGPIGCPLACCTVDWYYIILYGTKTFITLFLFRSVVCPHLVSQGETALQHKHDWRQELIVFDTNVRAAGCTATSTPLPCPSLRGATALQQWDNAPNRGTIMQGVRMLRTRWPSNSLPSSRTSQSGLVRGHHMLAGAIPRGSVVEGARVDISKGTSKDSSQGELRTELFAEGHRLLSGAIRIADRLEDTGDKILNPKP